MLRRTKFPSVLAGRLVVNKWWPTNFERIVLSNLSRGHCSKMSCACAVVAGKKISETWEGGIIRWTCQCRRRVDSKVWSFSAFFLGFHEFMPYNEPEKIDWHVREEVLVSQSGYVTCTTEFAETESFSRAFLKSKLISTCPFSFSSTSLIYILIFCQNPITVTSLQLIEHAHQFEIIIQWGCSL